MPVRAQKKFTLDDVTPGGKAYARFVPENIEQLQWWSDTLVFVRDSNIIRMRPATQKENVLCGLRELNEALKKDDLPLQHKIPPFSMPDKKQELIFYTKDYLVFYDLKTAGVAGKIKWKAEWKNKDYCPQNSHVAFTQNNDLYIISLNTKKKKVNRETEPNVVYGQAVHRNEWGIQKGTFWSPKGSYLAFYRMDESMVADYELVDNSKNPPEPQTIKYPAAGQVSHQVSVGIYNMKTGKVFYLHTGLPFDRFFTNIAWSPDEKELYVAELNREQDTCTLKAYNIKTGGVRSLFTETANTYVEPENPPLFIDTTRFVWQSERTGHNHLYLYNTDGVMLKHLTQGHWDVLELNGYEKDSETLIFASTEDSPLEKNIYKLSIKTGEKEKITTQGGQHQCLLSESGRFGVDSYTSTSTPRKIDIVQVMAPEKNVNLLNAPNPYAAYAMPEVQYGTLKAADGNADLYYRLTLPVPFDVHKKYPVIVHVYGGPHVQLVQNSWLGGSRGWELYMAQQGFIMFTLDGRGSANRGQAFEEAVFQNIGKAPLDDQLKGVSFLKTLPYVDSTRIGVYGWSFGGFMSTQLMCKAPGIFKVGVAGGAVIDWRLYEVMYGERYMQTPQRNPDGYAENDLTNYAKNLQGKFMMIHCELDPVVRILNTERFLEAAKSAGKNVDFVRYQKHGHNVQGKERVGLFEKISAYFIENLKEK